MVEIAAMPVNNAVTQFMAQHPQAPVGYVGGQGVNYSGAVQSGSYASMGARTRTSVHDYHSQLTGGVASSDMPALETLQPGYRRRG